jgi:choice-of-anchor B domain-containing protein
MLVVGAPLAREGVGSAYAYHRGEGGGWELVATLTTDHASEGAALGSAVVAQGHMAVVGAPGHDGNRGIAYVFGRHDEDGWRVRHTMQPDSLAEGARFGSAVSVSQGRMLVGAPGPGGATSVFGPPPTFRPGAAYVYRMDMENHELVLEATLASAEEGVLTQGLAVALMEHGALVSAPASNAGAGAVLAYHRDEAGEWSAAHAIAPDTPQPRSFFGSSIAISGDDLLIGAPTQGGLAGAVHVFRHEGDSLIHAQELTVSATGLGAFFGGAVSADGNLAVSGAPAADMFSGVGFVFERGDSGWTETAQVFDAGPNIPALTGEVRRCEDGASAAFTCADVDLVAFMPMADLGGERGVMLNDIWGWTDGETGTEYALVGRTDGMAFVDMSDPGYPVYVGELPKTEGTAGLLWRDVKVYQNHAYVVADNAGQHGVQIFDLRQLRGVSGDPVTFEATGNYDRIASAHNIVVNEETGFGYVVGASGGGETCGGGLHMMDLREDPANPTFAGCFADPNTGRSGTGYSHDAQCIIYQGPDVEHRGKEICFGSNETALSIADVSDKDSTVALSQAAYPSVGYAHQGWISADHRYFFLGDELDELSGNAPQTRTLVWDIEDLDDPVLATEYMGETAATDHNLYVKGQYMYQSNYVAGMRVIDISDPTAPVEVGYFDTVPFGEDAPGFSGSFSNYPYFASGVIAVTSMREGLFLLRKREQPVP